MNSNVVSIPNCVKYGYSSSIKCTCYGTQYNCGIGCLYYDSPIVTTEPVNTFVAIMDVKPGMVLANGAIVKKVVIYEREYTTMCHFGNCIYVTPWHPVLVGTDWKMPNDLYPTKYQKYGNVCNLVLEPGYNSFPVFNNITGEQHMFVSMGHCMEEPVHKYWGTMNVLNDLVLHPDYESGIIKIKNARYLRDEHGEVVKMISPQ